MVKRLGLMLSICTIISLVLQGFLGGIVSARDEGLQATGLIEPTPAQTEWMNKNFPVIQKFRLNNLALQRINTERTAKGLRSISETEVDVAPRGKEAVFGTPAVGDGLVSTSDTVGALPGSVDNSTSPAFPPIRSQGGIGSCAAWATTYYQFTYETNLARDTVASGGDNNLIFSPKWTYDMINRGVDGGSSFSDAYALELKNGAATWADFPYDTDYLEWCLDPAAWDEALTSRPLSGGQIYNSNTDTLISDIKTQLANGHILVIGTYVSSWVQKTVGNDPAVAEDDVFANQKIASYMKNTQQGGHGMTMVGYNDSLWCDLNSNGSVDSGEKGAFKIANSWGTGDWNKGFRWITYDSLRATSSAPVSASWPTSDRSSSGIFMSGRVYTLTASPAYTPTLKAEVTLNQANRGQLAVSLGIGDVTVTRPTTTWNSKAVYNSGGNHAFDGTATACDGTFFFDFTDLAKSVSGPKRWFVGVSDNAAGNVSLIKSFKLYQGDVLVAACNDLPEESADAGQVYAWVDYTLGTFNQPPKAVAAALPTGGIVPFIVNFDGSSSSDADGQIVSYDWNFGDNSTSSGVTASHTYSTAGQYTATLTVTDDKGARGSNSITINASNPINNPPSAVATASPVSGNIPLIVNFNGTGSNDSDGQVVSCAWNFGDGSTGTGVNTSHTYTKGGTFTATLTVTDDKGATGSNSLNIIAVDPNPVVLNAPTNLSARASRSSITLTWTDNSSNEEGFYIERATRNRWGSYSSYTRVGKVSDNIKTFTQSVSSGTYRYRVQAYNLTTGQVSGYSNVVTIRK